MKGEDSLLIVQCMWATGAVREGRIIGCGSVCVRLSQVPLKCYCRLLGGCYWCQATSSNEFVLFCCVFKSFPQATGCEEMCDRIHIKSFP